MIARSVVLKVADGFTVCLATQGLVGLGMVDALIQEVYRAIDKQKLRSSRVHRAEAPTPIPVIGSRAGRIRDLLWSGEPTRIERVDGNDSRRMRIAGRITPPERAIF